MQYPPFLKAKAKKIFAYFDKSRAIPELVYRFYGETCAIQVWPYLNFYYLEEDGSRTLRYATPDINFKRMNLREALECETRFHRLSSRNTPRFFKFWRKRRIHIRDNIREWMSYIPKELMEVFREWNQSFVYPERALFYASRSPYYCLLCINNPGLAYLLLRKEDWNRAHPLYEKNPLDVVGEKQGVLCELVGFSKYHTNIIRKIPVHYWEDKDLINSFQDFKQALNDPMVLKLLQRIKNLSRNSMELILTAYWEGCLDRLEISLLDQISFLEKKESLSGNILNKATFLRFSYQEYKKNTRKILFYSVLSVWGECVEFNPRWRIKTINSLHYHESLMIKQLNRISEKEEISAPTYFPKPPIPYQEWNQPGLFANNSSMTIIPIRNGYELLVAGKNMKNCAYSYKSSIVNGDYFCYLLKCVSGETYMVGFDRYYLNEDDMDMLNEGHLNRGWDEIFIPANEDEAILVSEYSLSYKEMWETLNSDDSPSKDTIIGCLWKLSEIRGVRNSEAPRHVVEELRKWLELEGSSGK